MERRRTSKKASGHKMSSLCSYAHVREMPGEIQANKKFFKKKGGDFSKVALKRVIFNGERKNF
jgi:hypothetical protein